MRSARVVARAFLMLTALAGPVVTGCSTDEPTPRAEATSTGTATPTPDVAAQRSPGTTATAASTTQAADPAGDVTDPEGDPPSDGAAADLRHVSVERHADGSLSIAFEVDGAIPPRADSLLWSVQADGGQSYTISAQLTGGELSAGIYDHRLDVQHALDDVRVAGSTVRLRVPDDEVDGLVVPFRWWALTQLDGAYEDRTEPVQVSAGSGP